MKCEHNWTVNLKDMYMTNPPKYYMKCKKCGKLKFTTKKEINTLFKGYTYCLTSEEK